MAAWSCYERHLLACDQPTSCSATAVEASLSATQHLALTCYHYHLRRIHWKDRDAVGQLAARMLVGQCGSSGTSR
jgi:hypothetical protein